MNPQVVCMRKTTDHRFQHEQGQTLLMFVLFLIVLFVFMGLGIDFGFAYITRARLSKAVDAAALAGMRSYSQGQAQATLVAKNAFAANYGTSGRDVAAPVPTVTFNTSNSNTTIDVKANVSINTFFLRALPAMPFYSGASWKTLSVGDEAVATRANLIMAVVLDVSGSMNSDGGIGGLKTAVPDFVNQFDNNNDEVAMVTFSCGATTPVPITTHFQSPINTAVASLNGISWTCSERGLTNGLAQTQSVPITAGENVIKVIVFFTDGLANTWYWPGFNCGAADIAPDKTTYSATALNSSKSCNVPSTIAGLSGTVTTSDQCGDMYAEAEARAEAVANLARSESNIVYSIGFGDPNSSFRECGHPPLNLAFLKNVANTPDSSTYNPNQLSGDVAIGSNPSDIDQLFQQIASKILLRLTK